MALKATIFKAELQLSDMDRHYYQHHALTIACHPSETEERMMLRILAFALHADADEMLGFGKGISTADEPDLWRKDLTGAIELWMDIGLPDATRVRKACHRAARVVVLACGDRAPQVWWQQNAAALERFENLEVLCLPAATGAQLGGLCQRSMRLDCLIQDGQVWLGDETTRLEVTPLRWKG